MPTSPAVRPVLRFVGPALTALVFVILLVWSWEKWPDVLIDFGRELYLPWQIVEGKRLYADIAYFNGPLSPSANALVFRLFGVSLRSLVVANVVILVVIGMMIYVVLRALGDRWTATAGSLVYLTMFSFGQFPRRGNYSFLAPYSHEMTHGTALSIAALTLLWIHIRKGNAWSVFGIGLSVGLAFLTKAEFVVAVVPAVLVGLSLHHYFQKTTRGAALRLAGLFASGAILPPAIAFLLLSLQLPPAMALKGVLGSWVYLFIGDLGDLKFYKEILGTSDLSDSLVQIGAWSLRYLAVLVPAAAIALALRRSWRGTVFVVIAVAPVASAVLLFNRQRIDWQTLARPLPVFLIVAVCLSLLALTRRESDPQRRARQVLGLACLLYALALLLKMFFNVQVFRYGFALALPASLAFVVILLEVVPDWIERRGGNRWAFRSAALGIFAAVAFVQLHATQDWFERRTVRVGSGYDTFLADDRDAAFARLSDRVEQLAQPDETLAVFPEGVMLNYLARMRNPTPFVNFMPPELIIFGEDRMVEALDMHPPTWVVYVDRSAREYGYRALGQDYGLSLMSWIQNNYLPVESVSYESARSDRPPFATILRRADGHVPEISPPPGSVP